MNLKSTSIALLGLTGLMAGGLVAPTVVHAAPKTEGAKRQEKKNNWRNLGAAGAAIAGYGLLKGNKTATILGGAGAAYSANRYENERKNQSKRSADRARYHRSNDSTYTENGRKYYTYNGDRYYMDLKSGERHKM